ncbi:MAG: hypothetical protein ACTHNS_02240 [Marmoricola sp.]
MVDRVFLHIGLPKTGTTYLQAVLWANRDQLRRDGVTIPGTGHREHLWAALDVQERKQLARRDPRAPGTWERLCEELDAAPGVGLVSHEFFCGASAEQARRVVTRLAPAEVHLVVTARDAAGMLAAGWQEMVKNGGEADLASVAGSDRRHEFSWQTWDLEGVLRRWAPTVPAAHVHVVPMPRAGEPPERHWLAFAEVLGLRSTYPLPERPVNRSLGAVQVELLRRINAHLDEFHASRDRGRWIRGYLAERHLARQGGERFVLDEGLVEDCRARSRRAVALIAEEGYDVVGDPGTLLVPDALPPGRPLASVTEAELVDSAGRLVAAMLGDARKREDAEPAPGPDTPVRSIASAVRNRLRRR